MTSSGRFRHQTHIQCSYRHVDKNSHIKINLKNKKKEKRKKMREKECVLSPREWEQKPLDTQ